MSKAEEIDMHSEMSDACCQSQVDSDKEYSEFISSFVIPDAGEPCEQRFSRSAVLSIHQFSDKRVLMG